MAASTQLKEQFPSLPPIVDLFSPWVVVYCYLDMRALLKIQYMNTLEWGTKLLHLIKGLRERAHG